MGQGWPPHPSLEGQCRWTCTSPVPWVPCRDHPGRSHLRRLPGNAKGPAAHGLRTCQFAHLYVRSSRLNSRSAATPLHSACAHQRASLVTSSSIVSALASQSRRRSLRPSNTIRTASLAAIARRCVRSASFRVVPGSCLSIFRAATSTRLVAAAARPSSSLQTSVRSFLPLRRESGCHHWS